MSHDCDCDSCQATDSRWAPHRATQKALKDDCPRGVHVADLWRATVGVGAKTTAEYKCKHCRVTVDAEGKRSVLPMAELRADLNRKLLEDSAPMCPDHRRYQAKRKPRVACEGCWRRYIHIKPPPPSKES